MTTSTATTTRRSPVRAGRGNRLANFEEQELATRGATALAPAPARKAATGTGKARLRVAPPVPVTVPRAPFVALVLIVVVAGVLGILVLNTKINENAFKLAQLRSQRSDLDQQLADLESPNSLAAAACRLGMVKSNTPAYLQLPNGQTVGVPQPATAAQCVTGQQPSGTTPGR